MVLFCKANEEGWAYQTVKRAHTGEMKIITGKIECNTERRAQFIIPGVALPDRGVRIVHACKDTGFTEFGS